MNGVKNNARAKRREPLTDAQLLMTISIGIFVAMYALAMIFMGGGKFRISGSILGAYIIQMLTTTLYAMNVPPVNVKAYKAVVIVIIVVAGSPVVKSKVTAMWNRLRSGGSTAAVQKGVRG